MPTAEKKEVARFPKHDGDRILEALLEMEDNPYSGDIRQLTPNEFRRRVGAYRITFLVVPRIRFVEVRSIFRRGSQTRKQYR